MSARVYFIKRIKDCKDGLEERKRALLFEILEGNKNKPFLTDQKVIVVLLFQHFIYKIIQKTVFNTKV